MLFSSDRWIEAKWAPYFLEKVGAVFPGESSLISIWTCFMAGKYLKIFIKMFGQR
jgi:hypothetical protein